MSREHEPESRDQELQRLLSEARQPVATSAFRARLRDQFMAEHGSCVDERPAAPRLVGGPDRTRNFPLLWPLVLAASIAAVLFFVLSRDADPRWRVLDTGAGGDFIVDGIRIHSSDPVRLADALQSAREIETFEGRLRLQLRQDVVLELDPMSRVSQMRFPPADSYSIYANFGSLRVVTGPSFAGNRLRVMSDNMEMAVVGTTFGVDIYAMGTCLCCVEGTVKSDPRDGQGMQPTGANEMCFAYGDGRKPARGPIVPAHAQGIVELQEYAAKLWKP